MSEERVLEPVEQKTVLFYGDEIVAVRTADGSIYVPIKPICDRLGVAWSGQRQRINRDPVLSEASAGARIMRAPKTGGGAQEMTCLPLDMLNGWLFGINANRVKDEVRPRLLRYQRECYRVLHEAFEEGRLTGDASLESLLQGDTPAAQAYRIARAVMDLARQQLLLEERVADHEGRLGAIEARLDDDGGTISEAQASQISQAVKAVAMALGERSGRNEYGGVYGELYRRFEITSYKLLPAGKFDEAMAWLTEWHQSLTGESAF